MIDTPTVNPHASLEQNDQVARPYVAPKIFSDEECDRIIVLSDELSPMDGGTAFGGDLKTSTTHRDSSIKWLMPGPDTAWVFERIRDAVNGVNNFFKFEFDGFKGIQIARYGIGGHYIWHSDLGVGLNSRRKLSISVQLSAPEDYDGGELEFQILQDEHNEPLKVGKERGSTIFFPSYMTHRVTPVTRGTRWSLVTWINGPPFR